MNRIKLAFTLSEVLITLGIIGIIAAMTLPSLVGKYKKVQTVNQLKKNYSTLAQAIKLSEAKNGEVKYWNFNLNGIDFYNQYLADFTTIDKKTVTQSKVKYYYLNGEKCKEALCSWDSYTVTLLDGSSLTISQYLASDIVPFKAKVILIDINGYRPPNTLGKDVFAFAINPKFGLTPFGYKDGGYSAQIFGEYNRDKITGDDDYACNHLKFGYWCSALILMDGWEIKDDYPW